MTNYLLLLTNLFFFNFSCSLSPFSFLLQHFLYAWSLNSAAGLYILSYTLIFVFTAVPISSVFVLSMPLIISFSYFISGVSFDTHWLHLNFLSFLKSVRVISLSMTRVVIAACTLFTLLIFSLSVTFFSGTFYAPFFWSFTLYAFSGTTGRTDTSDFLFTGAFIATFLLVFCYIRKTSPFYSLKN